MDLKVEGLRSESKQKHPCLLIDAEAKANRNLSPKEQRRACRRRAGKLEAEAKTGEGDGQRVCFGTGHQERRQSRVEKGGDRRQRKGELGGAGDGLEDRSQIDL